MIRPPSDSPDIQPLTRGQSKVLEAIVRHIADHGISPTLEEIVGLTGVKSRAGVQHHVRVLAEKGFIRRSRSARSIEVLISPSSLPQTLLEAMCVDYEGKDAWRKLSHEEREVRMAGMKRAVLTLLSPTSPLFPQPRRPRA